MEPGEERFWVTVDAFQRILEALAGVPNVRISFDDGTAADVEVALPALLERGLTATFFVVAGRLGADGSLGGDDVRELCRHGMGIGTHGMDHRPWRRLPPADRERELVEARARIAEVAGRPIDEAALPLGAYDRRLLSDLRRLGYAAVYTSDRAPARRGAWLQPRFSVVAGDTAESVRDRALVSPHLLRRMTLSAKGLVKRRR